MNDSQRRRLERLRRSAAEASANPAEFSDGSKGAQALAELKAAIVEAESHAVSRETSTNALQQATAGRSEAREVIRAGMRVISDTLRTIGRDHPEAKGVFVFSGGSVSDMNLLMMARSAANAARPLRTLFAEYDLSAEFFDKFDRDTENLEQQLNRQLSGKGERIAANASLEGALRGGEAALERLDTAISNKHRDDNAKLAAWQSARRLERAPRSRRKGGAQNGGGETTPPAQG